MLYFSELENKRVYTEDQILCGFLKDVVFLYEENPTVTKIVINTIDKNPLVIPISYIKKINNNITIKKQFETSSIDINEVSVTKNLLDKQIIDLVGNKVVRVNDVIIQDKPYLYISAVDIGFIGILRRIGLEHWFRNFVHLFGINIYSKFLSWADIQGLEVTQGQVKLRKREEKLAKIKAEDLADYLEMTNIRNARKFLKFLDEKNAAQVIGSLNINYQTAFFQHWPPEKAAKFINLIDPDEAVDILLTLSKRKREEIVNLLPVDKAHKIKHLMNLSTTPVGKVLTTEYFTVQSEMIVREIIDKIKKETSDYSFFAAIYVLNKEKELVGVFNIHELLLQDLDTPAYKFMVQNPIVIHLTTPIEIVVKKILKYRIPCFPVIDKNKHILGIVTFDNVSEFILKRYYERVSRKI